VIGQKRKGLFRFYHNQWQNREPIRNEIDCANMLYESIATIVYGESKSMLIAIRVAEACLPQSAPSSDVPRCTAYFYENRFPPEAIERSV
jgi:hypothetical protein